MDKIAQRIFAVLIGVAAIIYSAQVNPVNADSSPTQTYATGKYQMQFNTIYDSGSDRHSWYILVWDTETGRSKMYYGNTKMNKITAATDSYNLPSSPL